MSSRIDAARALVAHYDQRSNAGSGPMWCKRADELEAALCAEILGDPQWRPCYSDGEAVCGDMSFRANAAMEAKRFSPDGYIRPVYVGPKQ